MSFEYNYLRPGIVSDVTIIERSSAEYREFLDSIRGGKTDGQKEREQIIDENPEAVADFSGDVERITTAPGQIADEIVSGTGLGGDSHVWVSNAHEVLRDILEGNDTNPTARPFEYRGNCRHAQDDSFRSDDDAAMCCWECSNRPNDRPEKFDRGDDPIAECDRRLPGWKLEAMVEDDIDLSGFKGAIGDELSFHTIKRGIATLRADDEDEVRKFAIKWSYMKHLADIEDYHYQRAEAFLRDIDAPNAEQNSTGEGGRRFEQEAHRTLERYGFPQHPRVLRCSIDPTIAERGNGPDSPVRYKEMDIHTELEGEPTIIEVFTQRAQKEKHEQLRNYAELYEIATGTDPRTLLLTDNATCTVTLGMFETLASVNEHEAVRRGREEVEA